MLKNNHVPAEMSFTEIFSTPFRQQESIQLQCNFALSNSLDLTCHNLRNLKYDKVITKELQQRMYWFSLPFQSFSMWTFILFPNFLIVSWFQFPSRRSFELVKLNPYTDLVLIAIHRILISTQHLSIFWRQLLVMGWMKIATLVHGKYAVK